MGLGNEMPACCSGHSRSGVPGFSLGVRRLDMGVTYVYHISIVSTPAAPASQLRAGETALPQSWELLWGAPSPFYRRQIQQLRQALEVIAARIPAFDFEATFGDLVHPADNQTAPVHRWYTFKEAFSHRLPGELLRHLGAGTTGLIGDPFGGVATTALALQSDPRVSGVISAEYSPFAHFVGRTKLDWHFIDPHRMREKLDEALSFRRPRSPSAPALSTFTNQEIFTPSVLGGLLAAREQVASVPKLHDPDRAFLRVGLAAVIEDLSGAMKDGRALRILRGRRRRTTALRARSTPKTGRDTVKDALANQWHAMLEDVDALTMRRDAAASGHSLHVRGDARNLGALRLLDGSRAFNPGQVGLFLYSPPYLNCTDYSEIYKLELWLLELVRSQEAFRELRLGTLRSHPSIDFPSRGYLDGVQGQTVEVIRAIASFVERNGARRRIGRMIHNYFDDMYQVLAEQYLMLEPGGRIACVVANSTFSRRNKNGRTNDEVWRIPLLTDVLLAGLAEQIGFTDVQIWSTRHLRPRNVQGGSAREAIVVGQKPTKRSG